MRREWRAPLVQLVLAWVALVVVFASDWAAMAGQWWNSSTYNHILLIPPILAWLVAQRRHEVLQLAPRGWWPGLVLFAGAGLLWLLGDLAGLAIARQLALVLMAQASLAAILGPEVIAGLLFPLAYMLFLVPVGDEIIPLLQTLTARLTMVLLAMAHVPARISGVFITTPAGYFEVAEACSGIKFLIAMVAYGALVANVCYLRWSRRAAFMAVSVVVPILANGVRAFGTIWIAGWWGIGFAAGFDHVFYGWVFFAVVMALCVGVGWRWFDRPLNAPMIDPAAIRAHRLVRLLAGGRASPRVVLPGLALIALGFVGWATVSQSLAAKLPDGLRLPMARGWTAIETDAGTRWNPLHDGADQHVLMRFRNAQGQVVDVSFALYAAQGDGRQASGYGQGALPLGSRWSWEAPGPAVGLARSELIQAPGRERRLCLTWYRSGPLLTGSSLALRLHTMENHLLLRREATAVLILSASDRFDRDPAAALAAFMASVGPIQGWIDGLATGRR
jgi:exosortase A